MGRSTVKESIRGASYKFVSTKVLTRTVDKGFLVVPPVKVG